VPVSLAAEKPYRRFVTASPSPAYPATSSFADRFESLVARVTEATPAESIAAMHRAFEQRTGVFGADDAWFESRSRAFWDDAMTRRHAASSLRGKLSQEDQLWADALPHAHRGLFQSQDDAGGMVLTDVLGGAQLLVHAIDEASRDAIASTAGLFDGTVVAVASPVRLALLPGAIFHPEAAEDAIGAVVKAARALGVATEALLDALLRMEVSFRVLSRVKPSYAYRVEALGV
jgi:hypothetical protein